MDGAWAGGTAGAVDGAWAGGTAGAVDGAGATVEPCWVLITDFSAEGRLVTSRDPVLLTGGGDADALSSESSAPDVAAIAANRDAPLSPPASDSPVAATVPPAVASGDFSGAAAFFTPAFFAAAGSSG
ncbi:MAG: hypothetical protein ACYCV7_11275 [Acidimicrobiales bacterium]